MTATTGVSPVSVRWGVPIPIFYCKDCGEPLIEKDAMHAVSELFRAEGSDAWYIKEAEEILPAGTKCKKCGCTSFTKETRHHGRLV